MKTRDLSNVPDEDTPVSPKVTAAAFAAALATVIAAIGGLFDVAVPGEYSTAGGVLIGGAIAAVAAWARRDKLRDAGQAALGDGE